MKKIRIFSLLIVLFALSATHLKGQYLEVSRNANIRGDPSTNNPEIEKAKKGDCFFLLDSGQQVNGYYHVQCQTPGRTGWIYRTLVRRYEGQPPVTVTIPETDVELWPPPITLSTGQVPSGYYNGTDQLQDEALKARLHHIIKGHTVYSYDDVWKLLAVTDEDPCDTGNVILLYTMRSQPKYQRDRGPRFPYDDAGYRLVNAWNREHVWAKSRGFPNKKDTAYTDIHHLRPADRSVNTSRNNRAFDYCEEEYFETDDVPTDCRKCSVEWAWEPPDEVKGDVARMIFYMAVRYEGFEKDGRIVQDLEVVEEIPGIRDRKPRHGRLSTLLLWHEQDPVDDWERRRNNIIYEKYQHNRNPFIDHPEFVDRIFN